MKFVSVVVHVRREFYPHFRLQGPLQENRRKRHYRSICKELSRGLPALGVFHSHHSEKKGGAFAPHCHLIVQVPNDRLERFLRGLGADLRQKDKHCYFSLSAPSEWIIQDEKVDCWQYVLGNDRRHLPEIVLGKV